MTPERVPGPARCRCPRHRCIGNAELLNLRGVLADDPLRAVQVLPGVATGDDLRSEFTVRGSDFRHITFTVDGFATPYLLHAVRGVEDRGPTGSVAMINSDVLEDVTLLNGGYPQYFTGHTGAEVDFRLREGSRERPNRPRSPSAGRAASAVARGADRPAPRGSWLVSARQSYLDAIVHRLTDQRREFRVRGCAGEAGLRRVAAPPRRSDAARRALALRKRSGPARDRRRARRDGTRRSWAWQGGGSRRPRTILWQRLLAADNHFRNENTCGARAR